MTTPLPWIKVYGDLPSHRKSVTLAALTGEPRAWTHVVELWLWVSRHAPDGNLGAMPDAAVAAVAGWRKGSPAQFVDALRQSGFLDGNMVHGWHKHNGAHQRKQAADKARNDRRTSEPDPKINPPTSDSLVNHGNVTSVESIEYRVDKEQEKNLAIFENQKSANEPKRRGRPPKDQSPEAQAERQAERDDGERWIDRARALIGLSAAEAPWSSATFMSFRQARKKRGIEQLLRALDGLEGDRWAQQQGLAVLLSATLIEKGLARNSNHGGMGINATWEKIFAEGKTGAELPEDF